MILYIIRHGQTTSDPEDRYGGDHDDHLTGLGIEQAVALANTLKDSGIEFVYHSPLIRAAETAEFLKHRLKVGGGVLEKWKERNSYGPLTGMKRNEAKVLHPDLAELVKDPRNTIPGAESYKDFCDRIQNALEEAQNLPFNTAAIITHGGPLSLIFREVFNKGEVANGDCCFVKLEAKNGEFKIIELNNIEILNKFLN